MQNFLFLYKIEQPKYFQKVKYTLKEGLVKDVPLKFKFGSKVTCSKQQ